MTVRHIQDREDWYVIDINRGEEEGKPRWMSRGLWLHGPNVLAHAEWSLLHRYNFGYGFELGRNGGESDVGLNLHAGRLGSLYLRLGSPWTKWARVNREKHPDNWYEARHTGLRLFPHDGCLFSFEIDQLAHSWSSKDPWWRRWSLTKTTLFGRVRSEKEVTDSGTAQVPLPEGNYDATWEAQTYTTLYVGRLGILRDRILGPRRHHSINLSIEGGIPAEGKGENSWDCGMDGLFGCSGVTLEEAIGNAVRSTLRDRKRYGGPHDLTRPMTVTEAEQRHVG